eukprot:2441548-Amphidinium_carterae.1
MLVSIGRPATLDVHSCGNSIHVAHHFKVGPYPRTSPTSNSWVGGTVTLFGRYHGNNKFTSPQKWSCEKITNIYGFFTAFNYYKVNSCLFVGGSWFRATA